MTGSYAIVTVREGFFYAQPGSAGGGNESSITDVLLSGWAVLVLAQEETGWILARSFYGYEGWIWSGDVRVATAEELSARSEGSNIRSICARSLDLLSEPRVQGLIRETLLQGSFVELEPGPEDARQGWCLVRSAAGNTGWVFADGLCERASDDGFLLTADPDYFLKKAAEIILREGEKALRERAALSACSYLGCTYRWGGKSPMGIDCSGLVFMSWLEQGIMIYRDAQLKAGYPVREISRDQLKTGDLIFFPGHVAMFLGGEQYIHATGAVSSPCVRVNSLCPDDPDYREDLAGKITACGSLFA